ncbi:MAG: ArdC-like ssDNA-binding domain-containing protein [Oscillospiraceae bacterium]|jgi:antirestriction protein ArdC
MTERFEPGGMKLSEILEKLDEGMREYMATDKYRQYLKAMAVFHDYSARNVTLILMQKPDATQVAGYRTWLSKFERHVIKGEKGIRIIAPMPCEVVVERERIDPATRLAVKGPDGKSVMDRIVKKVPRFRMVSVFDVSQTEGKPVPQIETPDLEGDVLDYYSFLEAARRISPASIRIGEIHGTARGYFDPHGMEIAVASGMSQRQTVKTLVHELAHSVLHGAKTPGPDTKTREIEAESVAYAVCSHFGIDTSGYSFPYIAAWADGMKLDELRSSMDRISGASSRIIGGLEAEMASIDREGDAGELSLSIKRWFEECGMTGPGDGLSDPERLKAMLLGGDTSGIEARIDTILRENSGDSAVLQRADEVLEEISTFAARSRSSLERGIEAV